MKKLSTIIMALALVLGMSQCKKQEIPTNGGEKVHITLNVNNGESIAVNVDNGGRHAVAPNLGVIQFRDDDILYVGYNGHYIGYLTYENGAFDGDLDAPIDTVQDHLHFYFLGGKEPATAPTAGTTTSFTINIADQHDNLPVLCYGHSTKTYGSATNYSAVLEYKCALVKFNLSNPTEYECTLLKMPTTATISFATTSSNFTPIAKTNTTGTINLYAEEGNTGVRWAILLPGTKLSADGHVTGTGVNANSQNVTVGTALNANDFIKSGFTLHNPEFAAPNPTLAVKTSGGVMTQFSVSPTQKVYFSRANLKCNVSDPNQLVWGFHAKQYDECFGVKTYTSSGTPADQTGSGSSGVQYGSYEEMDRFSWGFQYPTVTGEDDWVNGTRNLSWYDGTDWGCALTGEGNDHWRTLTYEEWDYLLNNTSRGSRRFLKGRFQVSITRDGVTYNTYMSGMFIAPDGYTGNIAANSWNKLSTYGHSTMTAARTNKLFNDGCVFLPAVGYRNDSYYYDYNCYTSTSDFIQGCYWTATGLTQQPNSSSTPQAHAMKFDKTTNGYGNESYPTRDLGMCVRLVWDAYPK